MTNSNARRDIKQVLSHYQIESPGLDVNELVLDSREVAVHSVFVAIKGHALDGRDFIPQAISLGARLVLQSSDDSAMHGHIEMREQTVLITFYQLDQHLSELAARFYGFPAQQMDMIAVTGTNGKTSTVQLISQLKTLLGDKAASIGTLGAGLYTDNITELTKTINTTPDACQMQRLLAGFAEHQAKLVALEASSHALVQGRIEGLKTDVAVFTNLTRDHLDYHGSMAEYAMAKRKLISQPGLRNLVINIDDPESKNWRLQASHEQKLTVTSTNMSVQQVPHNAQYCIASHIQFNDQGTVFELSSSWGKATIKCGLIGHFNVANMLSAIASLLVLGHPLSDLVGACADVKPVAGRMELFESSEFGNLIVDYAHTPDALEQALRSARVHCKGKLVCVFGCGGDRDLGKRPLMGEVAQSFSDIVILTTDNSRTETPNAIVADILKGIDNSSCVLVETDRKQAIQMAIAQSQPGDLILVAGKGHETTQIIGQHSLPYDEREYAKTLTLGNSK
ncbi:UDP-N-acetylmuramoyl-L-alanyl-D-glutamate--2,6-diaminopimelate ligase [Aliiglaciecola sp.]|nr:UDP-N-acetylmuramoyl-L-alanyl-D-glutamate--2,6-diaminopimelate ligase [Aliiglaciecola sp.]